MNFEPQKFFIGLLDFFTILMPGAMLAYVVKDWGGAHLLGLNFGVGLDRAETVIVFLFFSYLLGHFVFLISSMLDDWIYDRLRALTDWGQISRRLAQGKKLSASWNRRFANWLFGRNADEAVIQAQRIKARALSPLEAGEAVNAFQWCKGRLLLMNDQQAFAAVQRFEADSKFFRSFFVVLAALTLVYAFRDQRPATAVCLVGTLLALWRYIDQRFKATQQAYWLIVAHEADSGKLAAAAPRPDGLTHAGGVVYRRKGKEPKFMLVAASRKRSEWVLPKGHIEPGEDPRNTAVREIKEETGHWARIVGWLGDRPLSRDAGAPMVRWFLLESCEAPRRWRPEDRRRGWFSLKSAIGFASFPQIDELLRQADARINRGN
jgi:8-oxo-dGTP pyrophosphatase MutT (NUDIX family)